MTRCCSFRSWLQLLLYDYTRLQYFAVILIYVQIGCALVGSLGAYFNGVLLIDLAVALFALVAIESSSQGLGRTYAVLLACSVLLDVSWFVLFSSEIWEMSPKDHSTFVLFSVKLALSMQIIGFSVRCLSSILWIQMYRLGASSVGHAGSGDFYLRNAFLNPASPDAARQPSGSDEILAGAVYDPVYYSSLFEGGEGEEQTYREVDALSKHEDV